MTRATTYYVEQGIMLWLILRFRWSVWHNSYRFVQGWLFYNLFYGVGLALQPDWKMVGKWLDNGWNKLENGWNKSENGWKMVGNGWKMVGKCLELKGSCIH